jgi:hypothetical protein
MQLNLLIFNFLNFFFIKFPISTMGACHIVAFLFTLKRIYLTAKAELWKLKLYTMQKYT